MSVFKNGTDLAKDGTSYVIQLDAEKNCTLVLQTDVGNGAAVQVRVDGSMDKLTWTTSIALQDPTAAIGAAFLSTLTGASKLGSTQDRLFGVAWARIVRTDVDVSTACKVLAGLSFNG